jgi:hypothetical protein
VIRDENLQEDGLNVPQEKVIPGNETALNSEDSQNAQPDDEQSPSKTEDVSAVTQSPGPPSHSETELDQWKSLIGQPAPELQPQGWLFGEATSLEKLRGRWVVLYFWENLISGQDLPGWVVLHNRFGDQGPVVIIVKPNDGESNKDAQNHFELVCLNCLEGRPLPFRALVDQGQPNVIPGTTLKTGGATHSAYRVANDRPAARTEPLALLIGPDGKVRQRIAHRPDRSVIRELETITGLKAGKPQWETALLQEYSLPAGTVLRRFSPPYSQARQDYCFFTQGSTEATMTFVQGEKLRESWSSLGTKGTLQFELSYVVGFKSYELVDPDEVASWKMFTGDWSVRAGAPREDVLRELERILKAEEGWNVRFERATMKQQVVVVTGDWKQAPLPGAQNESFIYFTADDVPDPIFGGGSSGSFDAMLAWLGDTVHMKFVSEVASPPTDSLTWRDQLEKHRHAIRNLTPEGQEFLSLTLENLSRQTGLSFETEERDVEVWKIVTE